MLANLEPMATTFLTHTNSSQAIFSLIVYLAYEVYGFIPLLWPITPYSAYSLTLEGGFVRLCLNLRFLVDDD